MRIPLALYLQGTESKVYSLVASAPFSPLDIDLGLLARGEWDALRDRFRIWYLPEIKGQNDSTLWYIIARKLDQQSDVLVYFHILPDLEPRTEGSDGGPSFMVGILSNDDVRARSSLGIILGIPPTFHRRSEVRLIERRWRADPQASARFAANVYSATTARFEEGDSTTNVRLHPSPDALAELKRHLGTWW